jgi:hypothetical protein
MTVTLTNDLGERVDVQVIHGTADRGIGYCGGKPVHLDGTAVVPGPRPRSRWMWGDGTGRYWTVVTAPGRSPYWVMLDHVLAPGSGWSLI